MQLQKRGMIFGNPSRSNRDPNIFEIHGEDCLIHIFDNQGAIKETVIIDREDLPKVSMYKWSADGKGYARTQTKTGTLSLHQAIMGPAPAGYDIDHADRNPRMNKKSNLRFATPNMNAMNKPGETGTSSQFKGVCWHKKAKKYEAKIGHNNKTLYLGLFYSEIKAALAYNAAAKMLFGEYAWLNEIREK